MEDKYIKAIESFNTWQGEGPDCGKSMLLLRFKKCNRYCSFCDTKQKLNNLDEFDIYLNDIQQNINKYKCGIMITGGEPTYDINFNQTLLIINSIHCKLFNVETNGFKLLDLIKSINVNSYKQQYVKYIYSPKFANKDDLTDALIKTNEIIKNNYNNVYFKIVYQNENLVRNYLESIKDQYIDQLFGRVYLMPEGKTIQELMKNSFECFNFAKHAGFNISSREHIVYNFV